ncbi:hypothetical protein DUI87_08154 [Hirundo rustica rustica]|uniref:Uncharacterized protein n=1 Tax=Hirundo rustica rustica TaxID=333673 RepID=A0A3M0L9M6_HIRRU|nr:hypothetical protein DUI87_08154 [Hirundo rustica rustica]
MVVSMILKAERRSHSKLNVLDIRKADFGFFRTLHSRIPWNKALEGRELQEIQLIFKSHPLKPQKRYILAEGKYSKNTRRPAYMNKEILEKPKEEAYTE